MAILTAMLMVVSVGGDIDSVGEVLVMDYITVTLVLQVMDYMGKLGRQEMAREAVSQARG